MKLVGLSLTLWVKRSWSTEESMNKTLCPVSLCIKRMLIRKLGVVFQEICFQRLQAHSQIFFFLIITSFPSSYLPIHTPIIIISTEIALALVTLALLLGMAVAGWFNGIAAQ